MRCVVRWPWTCAHVRDRVAAAAIAAAELSRKYFNPAAGHNVAAPKGSDHRMLPHKLTAANIKPFACTYLVAGHLRHHKSLNHARNRLGSVHRSRRSLSQRPLRTCAHMHPCIHAWPRIESHLCAFFPAQMQCSANVTEERQLSIHIRPHLPGLDAYPYVQHVVLWQILILHTLRRFVEQLLLASPS